MSDRLAFLRTIRANPEDDTARLVFADWLDEHDDPLGAFIRVQLELDPIRDRLEDPHVRRLIQREEQLLLEPSGRAFGAAFDCGDYLSHPEYIDFRRGLPEWMCVSLDTLLKHGEQLFEAYPTIRELAVFDIEGRGDRLAACKLLTRVDALEVTDRLTRADAMALAVSPFVRSVRRFVLWGGWSSQLGEALAPSATAEWPERIDVVWIQDGLAIALTAEDCDEPIGPDESFAHPINVRAGRVLAFDVRPACRLFPLRALSPTASGPEGDLELGIDSGHGLFYGRLPDGTPAVVATRENPWLLARFREDGRLIDIQERPSPVGNWDEVTYEIVVERVLADYRLTLAVVRVREFVGGDDRNAFGVHLWPRSIVEQYLLRSDRNPRLPESDWRKRGGTICRWLHKRDFVIDWGNDYWADSRGMIHLESQPAPFGA
jgi:uncharacterized protein (TIGR02996 family)